MKPIPQIRTAKEGFSVGEISIEWTSIRSIKAYKRDLITSDLVCLQIEFGSEPHYLDISEEWCGFTNLSESLVQRFAFPADWQEVVIQPPFASNETILFTKP